VHDLDRIYLHHVRAGPRLVHREFGAKVRPALQMLGCDTGQGDLFAKPLPAAELTALLTKIHIETG